MLSVPEKGIPVFQESIGWLVGHCKDLQPRPEASLYSIAARETLFVCVRGSLKGRKRKSDVKTGFGEKWSPREGKFQIILKQQTNRVALRLCTDNFIIHLCNKIQFINLCLEQRQQERGWKVWQETKRTAMSGILQSEESCSGQTHTNR